MGDNITAHEPPPIRQLSAPDLKALLESGNAIELVDVRTEEERAIASITGIAFARFSPEGMPPQPHGKTTDPAAGR